MKFDTFDKALNPKEKELAEKKFNWLTLELGVREDNQHIGSGLGGNNAQLFALMSFHNELVNDASTKIKIDRGLIQWGSDWFLSAGRKLIRHELDAVLPIQKYTPLETILNDQRFSLGPNVSRWTVLLYAFDLCKKLADELDRGDTSNVQVTALSLYGFPMETVLLSVRRFIQIERLVRFNLDEHPDFGKILSKINREVDN